MTQTTSSIINGLRTLKSYQTLEIKRRYQSGYEANWFDVSEYLLSSGKPSITYKLDIDDFGWGEFKTSNASFELNNRGGAFEPPNTATVSLFNDTLSRHYTKIRYKSGYKDQTGSAIDETVFTGLLNEKSINMNFSNATLSFYAVSNQSIFGEKVTYTNSLSGSKTATQVISWVMNRSDIQSMVVFDASTINLGVNTLFDDTSFFNEVKYDELFTDLAKRTNSAWYVDLITNKLTFRSRTVTTSPVYAFLGGNIASKDVNIIKNGIIRYDEGYDKIINRIVYDTQDTVGGTYSFDDSTSQTLYGVNQLDLSGKGLTTFSAINSLCTGIINQFKNPKRRITVKTIYLPNVLNLFDVISLEFYGDRLADDTFIWNYNSLNDNKYYYVLDSGFYIQNTSWVVMGWEHDTDNKISTWYLLEK